MSAKKKNMVESTKALCQMMREHADLMEKLAKVVKANNYPNAIRADLMVETLFLVRRTHNLLARITEHVA